MFTHHQIHGSGHHRPGHNTKEFPMCRPVPCSKCGKTTWAGCGQHIDQVKAQVPAGQWCTCPRENNAGGFLSKIFDKN